MAPHMERAVDQNTDVLERLDRGITIIEQIEKLLSYLSEESELKVTFNKKHKKMNQLFDLNYI